MTTHTTDHRTETDAAIEAARAALNAQQLDPRGLYLTTNRDGTRELLDITHQIHELDQRLPARKTGTYEVTTPDDLIDYLAKHSEQDLTELWGNDHRGTIHAIINGHGGPELGPSHEDHTITLHLPFTTDWNDWTSRDGQLFPQLEFSEFIEDHLPNFTTPTAADMLELAQTFQATTRVEFASSQRLKTGETALAYEETQSAQAGKKGRLAIPDTFTLALQVYERGTTYKVTARFRYRITSGQLSLGYRLNRINDIRAAAFDDVTQHVTDKTGITVWHTT